MIEKAYKKLRLDALVIQQGRLTENTKTVNKDDLLSMVRYGAEMVFSSSVRAPTCVVLACQSVFSLCCYGRPGAIVRMPRCCGSGPVFSRLHSPEHRHARTSLQQSPRASRR